jgi:xanthine dehydrogenase YagT iron-sulfur-binding subunit
LLVNPRRITLRVSGLNHMVTVEPRDSLLDVVRKQLGLTVANKGCDMGSCDACTVMVGARSRLSCLTLAVPVESMDIVTAEALDSVICPRLATTSTDTET